MIYSPAEIAQIRRSAAAKAKRAAFKAGYSLRQGSYQGTSDDVLGRWYVIHSTDTEFSPRGQGYASQTEAWFGIAETMQQNAILARYATAYA